MKIKRFLIGAAIMASAMITAPVAAQDFPVDFLKMNAMRRQEPAPSANAIAAYVAAAQLPAETKSRVDGLLAEARSAIGNGDRAGAERALAEARVLSGGGQWTAAEVYANSFGLSVASPLVDVAEPLKINVAPIYPNARADARLRVNALVAGKEPTVLGEVPLRGIGGRATSLSLKLPADLAGRANLRFDVMVDGRVAGQSSERVDFVRDLAGLERQAEERLKKVKASDAATAVVRYPFNLARLLRSGRDIEARAFADRLNRSRSVLAELEAGRDPVLRATGDQDRAYWFADADEIVPYRIYVPTNWKSTDKLPVILALHGGGGDENGMLASAESGSKFQKLAERYGYIVISPLGYRPLGAYGSPIRLPSVYGSDTKDGRDVGGPERARLLELSEKDVLNVLELVISEYGADRERVYLTGHSMGGGGTWYLAHQYPQLWDAIASSAGPFFIDNYDLERLRNMGVMIVQGSGDPPSLDANRRVAIDLLKRGIGVNYIETPSVNHGQTFGNSLPSIFEFFERQKLRDNPAVPLELR